MMMIQDAYEELHGGKDDGLGKTFVAFMIVGANAAASGLYPIWRFFNAWSESGEIDFSFIGGYLKSAAEKCLGPEIVASLIGCFGCLASAKEYADTAQEERDIASASAESTSHIMDNVREISTERVSVSSIVFDPEFEFEPRINSHDLRLPSLRRRSSHGFVQDIIPSELTPADTAGQESVGI